MNRIKLYFSQLLICISLKNLIKKALHLTMQSLYTFHIYVSPFTSIFIFQYEYRLFVPPDLHPRIFYHISFVFSRKRMLFIIITLFLTPHPNQNHKPRFCHHTHLISLRNSYDWDLHFPLGFCHLIVLHTFELV